MLSLRRLFLRHRALAMFMVMAALCMKLVVPAGYMIGSENHVLTVLICEDSRQSHTTAKITVPGKADPGQHAKGECPFTALSAASLGAVDPLVLALALAFAMALALRPGPGLPLRRIAHLRPPLRGPPALS